MNKLRMLGAVSIAALSALSLASCKIKGISSGDDSSSSSSDVITDNHTISFYLNGSLYTTLKVSDGGSLKETDLPEVPVVSGYTVTWDLTNISLSNITSDITINALLVANEYTITYYLTDASGNTTLYTTQTYSYGEAVSAPSVTTEEGYAFSGWSNLPSTMSAGNLEIYGSINEIDGTIDISTYASGSTITLSTAGTYEIVGENSDVSIELTSTEQSNIIINGVLDTNLTKAFITSAAKLSLTISSNNIITDSISNTASALIYSAGELSILGSGSLDITSSNADTAAIQSYKSNLNITSGTITIASAGVGLQAKGSGASLNVSGGMLTVNSTDDAIKAKVGVNISGGTTNLTSNEADGINAGSVLVSSGTLIIKSKNDGIQGDDNVTISGGEVTITANDGTSGSATLAQSTTSFVFEEEDTSSFTTADEYYGLYILKSGTYIEIDEDNYSTYKSYTVFYDRASCKGLKSDTLVSITGGSVNINSLDDGINCDAEVSITGGNTTIQSKGDGINADELLSITDGSLNISTEGTFYAVSGGSYKKSGTTYVKADSGSYDLYTSCKGLKSKNEIVLNGGTYVINTSDDAIHSDEYVTVLGGEYTIDTIDDGMHADTTLQIGESGADNSKISIKINTAYEGIEAGTINIYSGTIDAYATDDCMNAGGGSSSSTTDTFNPGGSRGGFMSGGSTSTSTSSYSINIYGGVIVLYCPSGDTDVIDSNGSFTQSGGVIVAHNAGSSGTATALDTDGSATITGGIFVGIGNLETTPSVSNVKKQTVSVSLSSGTTYTLTDSNSSTLASFTMRATYSKITFISPTGTYKIMKNSTTIVTITQ